MKRSQTVQPGRAWITTILAALSGALVWAATGVQATVISTNGLVLYVRADAGVTTGPGSLVNTWADQSTPANDATQTTDARKPTLVNNVYNGQPSLNFDGGDWMELGANVPDLAITGDLTIVALVRKDVASDRGVILSYQSDPGFRNAYELRYNDAATAPFNFVHADDSNVQTVTSASGTTDGVFSTVSLVRSNATLSFFIDGVAAGSFASTLTPTTDTLSVGRVGGRSDAPNLNFPGGYISSIALYNRGLSDAERVEVANNLMAALPVPEPSMAVLLGAGGLILWRWRSRKME